ncbi:MAG: deoxyhypusine synthase family protein [Candidatus Kerfeldbacteria bacterium]|nr:deoxyhypusine synthase family protein [Candidatus Kerfeldbacteria bacterium]
MMEPLEPLDLSRCHTVGDIVNAMSRCSFGARMLGEVAATLTGWVDHGEKPYCVYDGLGDTPLGLLLRAMVSNGWFRSILTPAEYDSLKCAETTTIVVVGPYPERYSKAVEHRAHDGIYINASEQSPMHFIKDGYFRNVIFADPRFILPVLDAVLEERLKGQGLMVREFFADLPLYGGTAFRVAEGAQTLQAMVADPRCTVFLTLSGAMTIAKMGLVVCDMIDHGMVQYIASTGALMAHGLVESIGRKHYKHRPEHDDALLAEQKLNRVTDTLEPEENLDEVSRVLDLILDQINGGNPISTHELHQRIGAYLIEECPAERAILASAARRNVPVVVPAFVDSELGNDVFVHNRRRLAEGRQRVVINPELDSELLVQMMLDGDRLGIFSIGGGVPRNNTQNGAPLIEITSDRLGLNWPMKKFAYGCRISPDAPYYGHLSGCTYDENKSWRKMETTGRFTEIRADATQVWPFLVKYVMETL